MLIVPHLNTTRRKNIVMIIIIILTTLHIVTANYIFNAVEDVEGGYFTLFSKQGEERFQS